MKKKIIFVSLLAAFLMTHTACEDEKGDYLSDFSTILSFRNSGEIPLDIYSTGDDTEYQVVINKGGSELKATTEVSVGVMDDAALAIYNAEQWTFYKALPATCYELKGETKFNFAASDMYKTLDVVLKTELIKELPALKSGESYVIPLQLQNSTDSINSKIGMAFIQPNVVIPTVFFSKSGYTQNFFSDNGPVKMNFTLPVEISLPSNWDFSCGLTIDETLLDEYNTENECDYALLPTSAYTMGTTVSFTNDKESVKEANIEVDRTSLEYGNYVLPVRLSSCTKPQFVIDSDKSTSLYAISYVPDASKLSKVALTESMISIYPTWVNEGSIAEMLDGVADTYFHSAWGSGPNGEALPPLPHWIQVELPKECTAVSIGYQVRHNNANGAPQQYSLAGSMDGVNFSKIATVTDDLPAKTGETYTSPVFVGKPFKYLRVIVEKTGSGNSFAFAEFSMSTN
ncbi:BT_3987 domain-containing protein [Bacteroides sp.]